ncbi:MAG: transcription antitermination factor NusB [Microbacteriaceae bacterium]
MTKVTSRLIAAELLAGVILDGSYANLLLPRLLADSGLNQQDRALATELSYGTLRMQGSIDQILQQLSNRPIYEIDTEVLIALRLGSYQLLATRIPSHAAVDEAVKLVRTMHKSSAAGFVNAMLRRVSEKSFEEWADILHPIQNAEAALSDSRLSFVYAHPEWIIRSFRDSLRADRSVQKLDAKQIETELIALLEANNAAPQVNLAILPIADDQDRAEVEKDTTALPYSPYARLLASGLPGRFKALRAGRIRVQDQGSQLAALALIGAKPIQDGEAWADFCAGPGGKAALLASIADEHRGTFLANELNPIRARLVEQALAPINPDAELRVGDARDFSSGNEKFDRIMLDAPCSGIGALRRRPEARWQKTPRDIGTLVPLQEDLLGAAINSLKPGGVLAYVTCSSHLAETEQLVSQVLKSHPEMIELDTASLLQAQSVNPIPDIVGGAKRVQLWPHRQGTDAMFITLLQAPLS